jgi:hypothetical protein
MMIGVSGIGPYFFYIDGCRFMVSVVGCGHTARLRDPTTRLVYRYDITMPFLRDSFRVIRQSLIFGKQEIDLLPLLLQALALTIIKPPAYIRAYAGKSIFISVDGNRRLHGRGGG